MSNREQELLSAIQKIYDIASGREISGLPLNDIRAICLEKLHPNAIIVDTPQRFAQEELEKMRTRCEEFDRMVNNPRRDWFDINDA
jgi:hypothetical protein